MGGGDTVLIEIIIFAMIAAFLVYRLRSVLGRRNGEERERPNPLARRGGMTDRESMRDRDQGRDTGRDNVITLPDRGRGGDDFRHGTSQADAPQSLAAHLDRIHDADPSFDEKDFLRGARQAFEMIVGAFAAGDIDALRPLLAPEVLDNFSRAITKRQASGETLETRIGRINDVDVIDAKLDGSVAHVTVRFVSDQTNVTRDSAGDILDGDPDAPAEVVDDWTFARDTRSRDPNWQLVATRSPS